MLVGMGVGLGINVVLRGASLWASVTVSFHLCSEGVLNIIFGGSPLRQPHSLTAELFWCETLLSFLITGVCTYSSTYVSDS